VSSPGIRETTSILEHSDVESKRFGFRICRGTVDDINQAALAHAIIEQEADIAIIRVPSKRQRHISRLDQTGLPYLVADTLVCYEADLTADTIRPRSGTDLHFVRCGATHANVLSNLAREVFADYVNHYRASPYLDREDIRAGFADWASRYAVDRNEHMAGWFVEKDGEPVGFVTFDVGNDTCDVALIGVSPAWIGKGIASNLVRFTQSHFKERGFGRMLVSTQSHNLAAQRLYLGEKFRPSGSYVTIHVNSMLSYSAVEKRVIPLSVSADGVLSCPEIDVGSTGAPGVALSHTLCYYYETVFPGEGAVLIRRAETLVRAIHPSRAYRLAISFPYVDEKRGSYESLARVFDEKNNICLLCYSYLNETGR
jgi:ribosomal protein S18 acetylase RimI-like enzyme